METETRKPETLVPPVFAFRTLQNTLEDMKKRGIPNRIDRTFLTGMSGAGQTQFITGLRSLGLIDAAGTVQPALKQMVEGSAEDRRRLLREVLEKRYPQAIELGKTNATTGQLVEVFREHFGAHGDTARKGIAFYLQAAKFAGGIPLSPLFQTPRVTSAAPSKKRRKSGEAQEKPGEGEGQGTGDASLPRFHSILSGVLSEFPAHPKGWTQDRRDEVMKMFEMAVGFTIPIVDAAEDQEEPEPEPEEVDEELEE